MAYQNRIDFTVESFKGLNNRASNFANCALNMFEIHTNLFRELSEMNNNPLIKRIPLNIKYVSGIPGTQYDAIENISRIMVDFFSSANFIEKEASQTIDEVKKEYSTSSSQMNDFLTGMCSNSHQIDVIKNSIRDQKEHLPSKLSKYQKSINSIVTSKTKSKKASDIVNLMEKVFAIRKENDMFKRSKFVYAANKCMNGITQNSEKAVKLLKVQFSTQISEFKNQIKQSNQQIIDKCNEFDDQLIRTINMINFQKDFTNYVHTYRIIRYDLLPKSFKALDFNHECFSNITTIYKVLSLQLYPYAMAKMKKDFIATDGNGITVQKGKIVLLMEDLSLPWAFVQNPITKVMGYAPSSFLEEIGNGLGVLLEEFKTSEELLRKGDYIAIEGDAGSGNKFVHTLADGTAKIPTSMIGIISEF